MVAHILGGQLKTFLGRRWDQFRNAPCSDDEVLVGRIGGVRQQYLVAGVDHGHGRQQQGARGSGGNDDAGRINRRIEVPGVVACNGFPQRGQTQRGRVGRQPCMRGSIQCFHNLCRCGKVRFADSQADDIMTLGVKCVGLFEQFDGIEWQNGATALGQCGHGESLQWALSRQRVGQSSRY